MTMDEGIAYDADPAYLASLTDLRPLPQGWSTSKPANPGPQQLSEAERQTVIMANLDMPAIEVSTWQRKGTRIDAEEALGDAALGLVEAAHSYDKTLGTRFTAFAHHRVRGNVIDGVRSYNRLQGKARKEATVVSLFNNTRARSIFEPVFNMRHGGIVTVEEIVPADQPDIEMTVEKAEEVRFLYEAIDRLPERQKMAILGRLACQRRKDIAGALGISESTVGRDLKKARQALLAMLQPLLFDTD